MNTIRSLLFSTFMNLWGVIVPIVYFPVFITRNKKMADRGAKTWAKYSLLALKYLCKIDHRIVGQQRVPKTACIIACKHQSMWDTMIMNILFKGPAYAYKKELLKIPFFGWLLKRTTGIRIDRSGGMSTLKNLITQGKECLAKGHNIVIFPQGTRTPPETTANDSLFPYQSGIVALYLACGVPVIPTALNSGVFWGKHKVKKRSGTITMEFLKPIEPGLSKEDFMAKLIDAIETRSAELCKVAQKQ